MDTDKILFQEADEIFVKRAGQLRADSPCQSLLASKRLDGDTFLDVGSKTTILSIANNRTGRKFLNLHVVRQFLAVNKYTVIFEKKMTGARYAEGDEVHALGHQAAKRFRLLRVVGNAFDGFLHSGKSMEVFE